MAGSLFAPSLLVRTPPPKCSERFLATRTARKPKLVLPNARRCAFRPEVDAEHFLMGKPDRSMMVVIRCTGMPHACQRRSRRPDQRKEERSWIGRAEMPAQALDAVDAE